ncbi:hypothetical protein [Corynebacterium glutamicum]|uniref:hypothetical protein n=1 Tax=Corynebacterium glutamicum TaxID=1718 RepID=UPI001303F646|nr:hypothetical protein [Corynebacterium glutamicum]
MILIEVALGFYTTIILTATSGISVATGLHPYEQLDYLQGSIGAPQTAGFLDVLSH